MIIEQDVEEFLEHHGVRGMRWGQRSRKQKALVVGAGFVGAKFSMKFLSSGLKTPMRLLLAVATADAAIQATKHILDNKGSTKISDLSNE